MGSSGLCGCDSVRALRSVKRNCCFRNDCNGGTSCYRNSNLQVQDEQISTDTHAVTGLHL